MKISVAMCTFNGARTMRAQLDSICAQSRLPNELVVCDDSSSDGSADLVRSWGVTAPFPVKLHDNGCRLGLIKNFEQAISSCSGDIIALSDQDDVWLPDKLARLEQAFSSSRNPGLVFGDARVVDQGLRPLGYTLWESCRFGPKQRRLVREGDPTKILLRHNVVMGAAMAFRSEYRRHLIPIPENPVHIHDYWIAFILAAIAPIDFVEEPLLLYRQHGQQHVGAHPPISASWIHSQITPDLHTKNVAAYRASIEWLEALLARLQALHEEVLVDEWVIRQVRTKLQHARAGSGLPCARWRRLPSIARELATLRYHRYSIGVWRAAKDLV
jgi:glycosyltransferase involved in cell wall biosynthesis